MNGCNQVQACFTEYLDGRLTGHKMQAIDAHLDSCAECAREWKAQREMQASLAGLGPVPEPADLPLRIRVAVSQEIARSRRNLLDAWELAWKNTVGPFLLQASAGFASATLLLGTVVLMSPCSPSPKLHRPSPTSRWAMPPLHVCFISPMLRAAMRRAPFPARWSLKPMSTVKAKSTITASSPAPTMTRPAPR